MNNKSNDPNLPKKSSIKSNDIDDLELGVFLIEVTRILIVKIYLRSCLIR